jgi:hypothetical protein
MADATKPLIREGRLSIINATLNNQKQGGQIKAQADVDAISKLGDMSN